ncbi:MAG TPA: histidine phosphatase family protein [Caulobacteraceae bacterium]|jgi:broad specificity phosphatase PhoE|nr:histidine phosphatase family protein [Caulobacteraceae bacterium]
MTSRPVPGPIILVRHGEPALTRDLWINARGYREWWAAYEVGGLKSPQSPPDDLGPLIADAFELTASTLRRSLESAQALAQGRPIHPHGLFVEAPLPPPPLPDWLKLRPRWWGVIARAWWQLLPPRTGEETPRQARDRAERGARELIARADRGETVVLVAHGWFNLLIGRALMRRGWRRTLDQGFRHWCARRFEAPP